MSARTALLLTFRSLPSWKHRVPAYLSGPTLWCYFCSFSYSGFLDTLFCDISADQSDIASYKCDSSWKEPQQVLVSGQEEITYGCVVIVIFFEQVFVVSRVSDRWCDKKLLCCGLIPAICIAKKEKQCLWMQNMCQDAKRSSLTNGTKWFFNAVQVFITENYKQYLI